MIPNDQPLRKDMIERMINTLLGRDDMNNWETNFIDSIYEQFKHRGDLTSRQCEILERIHDRL